jgi:Ni,Fe-hydrogenase III large subunit
VLARLEGVGTLAPEHAIALGVVGVAARASGLSIDARHDHATGLYRMTHIPIATSPDGDVHARAIVRWLELQRSLDFLRAALRELPARPVHSPCPSPRPQAAVVSLVEGWRGEVAHVALTDEQGRFERYKITDPSFRNWPGLELAMRDQQISDFPLCNKSFNLSYSGHDL